MQSEYQILTYLQENEQTFQRNISRRTGLSNYIRSFYWQIINVTSAVEKLFKTKQEILITTLHNMNLTPRIIQPENGNFKPEPKQFILTWRCEVKELFSSNQVYNIMNLI